MLLNQFRAFSVSQSTQNMIIGGLSQHQGNTESHKTPGGVLPYMGHIGMCRCEGYSFQAVYSSIGYINQSVWV